MEPTHNATSNAACFNEEKRVVGEFLNFWVYQIVRPPAKYPPAFYPAA